jgi:uncharacterized membrane protein YdjX (TVP38/TMEM64 family)
MEFLSAATSPEALRRWVEGYGMLGPLAFFLAEAAQVVFSPLPGGLLPPVAVGAAIVFLLARRFGRPLVRRLVPAETIDRYAGVLAAKGGLWLFVVMAVPVFPGDAICAMAGLSSLTFGRFMAVSTLGRLPSTALGIFLATELSTAPGVPGWVLPVVGVGLAAVVIGGAFQRGEWLARKGMRVTS